VLVTPNGYLAAGNDHLVSEALAIRRKLRSSGYRV